MISRAWFLCGAILAAAAVALGAYHAHGLERQLTADGIAEAELAKRLANFDVGVRYQMYSAIGLMLIALTSGLRRSVTLQFAGMAFLTGTVLFCGLLYLLSLTGRHFHPALIPSGGLGLILGWLLLGFGAWPRFSAGPRDAT